MRRRLRVLQGRADGRDHGPATDPGVRATRILFGIIWLAIGAVEIYAGLGILRLREQARILGVVIAGASAALTVISIASGAGGGFVGLLIDAFIWALVTNKELFA